ncbi:C-C motif chemokine 20 [Betta splendens]|uniref:C-C motif chemokine n=1 Tax=Betta splendens TaxID=158456 RepID=A0A6P7L0M5_BETSP|nr:C-C motif chemokine 20 [Betta splendens]
MTMGKLLVCVTQLILLLVVLSEGSRRFCCTKYHQSPIPDRLLKYYIIQDAAQNCNIEAIIFRTVRNRLVCASRDSEWVQRALETVPE